MSSAIRVLDTAGPAAPPRDNGELTFRDPWESRLFGLTMALYSRGLFEWDDFRCLLIEEIERWESLHTRDDEWHYYECWRAAFERLADDTRLVVAEELHERAETFAARSAGHDHRH